MKQPFYALLDILPLTASTYALTAKAYKVDPRTIYLLLPYCAWLTYASYLNGTPFSRVQKLNSRP